ncbi:MAG: glycosyltransferase [Deltaproteobacteria bacterium]|nr:glycosyltransferase [Deltaproteobacteria bacterium]
MTPPKPSLSLCMILRDEAENLEISLGPIRDCFDEIVIVDTGSKDHTPELARSFGARVIQTNWGDDFAAARNMSIKEARGDWILWLDGDNRLTPRDIEEIRQHLDFKKESVLWCLEEVEPEGEQLMQKRVFPNRPEVKFKGRVHEQLVHPAHYRSIFTAVKIYHWGYKDRAEARKKGERNLRILQAMAEEEPGDAYVNYQLGKTLFNLRQYNQALKCLSLAARPENNGLINEGLFLHSHILRARTLDRLGQFQEAEECLEETLAKNTEYGLAHYYMGRFLYARSSYKTAEVHLRSFLLLGTNDLRVGLNTARLTYTASLLRAKCLEATGDIPGAESAYCYAAQMDSNSPEPRLALSRLSLEQNRTSEARSYAHECLQISPGNRRAIELIGEISARG